MVWAKTPGVINRIRYLEEITGAIPGGGVSISGSGNTCSVIAVLYISCFLLVPFMLKVFACLLAGQRILLSSENFLCIC